MKAALINSFGDPSVVGTGEAGLRVASPNEVVVRVEAAGINPLDLKIIAGYMQQVFPVSLPYVPGTDFSGVVERIGSEVNTVKVGDRVFGRTSPGEGGAFARQVVVAQQALCVLAEQMSFEQAAALPTTFGTANQALFEVGKLKQGERVLIHGGAGGVGTMAVQLAHRAGAYVIATASEGNRALVTALGADEVVDYRTQDVGQIRDVDLVLDTIGGETLEKSWSTLREGGRIATLADFNIAARNGNEGTFVFFADASSHLRAAVEQFEAGQLQIVIDAAFALEDARAALEKVATGHSRGKVLIRTSN